MIASDLIKEGQFPAEIGMTVGEVRELCIANRASELPVIKQGEVIGMIRLSLLKSLPMSQFIDDVVETGLVHTINGLTHEFEYLKLMSAQSVSSLAVVDDKGEYQGLVTMVSTMEEIDRRCLVS